MKTYRVELLLVTLLFLAQLVTWGQETRGTLLGRISDPSGALIVGANIEALNPDTGIRTAARSNSRGEFLIPFLTPGPYTLSAEASGFKKVVRQGILVRVNDRISIDFTMELGGTVETVQVTAETPLLDTSTGSVGTVVDNKSIMELPLQHGMVLMMANLSPGVTNLNSNANYTRPFDTSNPSNIAVSGARIGTHQFLVDGAPNMQRGEIAYAPPPGVVSEFKIQTSTFDAAAGYATGAVVNMSLASGTNDLHGQMSYFLQNPVLNANRFFLNSISAPRYSFREHRWGTTLSGPVVIPKLYNGRNRTFWLYGYEAEWTFDPAAFSTQTVPLPTQPQGDFSGLLALGPQYQIYDPYSTVPAGSGLFRRTPLAGNVIPQNSINPIGRKIANLYDPGNQPAAADGVSNLNYASNAQDYYWNHLAKIDHNVSDRQRFFVRFNYTMLDRPWHIAHHGALGDLFQRRNRGAAFDDVFTLSPSLILNLRYSYTRFVFTGLSLQKGWDLAGLGFSNTFINQIMAVDPARVGLPQLQVTGYQTLSDVADNSRVDDTHDFGVNLTKTTGTHTLRFGAGRRIYRENFFSKSNASGLLTFGTDWTKGPNSTSGASPIGQGLASLLYGLPTAGNFPLVTDYAEQTSFWGLYVQDDWKVSPKLTVNLGFRYELPSPLTERYNRSVRGFDSTAASPVESQALANYAGSPIAEIPVSQFRVKGGLTFAGVNGAPRSLWGYVKKNFMPRSGLAYSFNPKTIFRAGFAVYFEPMAIVNTHVIQTAFSRNTDLVSSVDNGQSFLATIANPFPNGFLPPLGAAAGLSANLGQGVSFFNPNIENPYTQRWQAALQRELPARSVLEVSYVGNRTVRERVQRDLNALPNQYLSTLPTRDQTTINFLAAQVPNPFYPLLPSTSLSNTTVARSQLLRPFPQFTTVMMDTNQGYSYYHALQVHFEKRFSTGLMSTVSYTGSKMMDATSYRNAGDAMPEKVISVQDRPHRVTVSGICLLPFGKGSSGTLAKMIGGWQVQTIYAWQSGAPLGFGNAIFVGDLHSIALRRGERTADRWFNTDSFQRNSTLQLASNLQTLSTRFSGIRGDGINNLDFSLLKDTPIKERLKMQFRAEAINLMNHPQFNPPNTTPTSSAFGRVTTESSVPRVVQLGVKLLF